MRSELNVRFSGVLSDATRKSMNCRTFGGT